MSSSTLGSRGDCSGAEQEGSLMYQVWCVSLNILESFLGNKSNSVNLLGPNHSLLWEPSCAL